MAAVNKVNSASYGNDKQILIAPEVAVEIGCLVTNTGVSADSEGKKIIKAGTPVGSSTNVLMNRQTVLTVVSDATAQGVLLHDVDVTAGQENATLVIEGVIDYEKVDEDVQAMYTSTVTGAMPKVTIVKGSKV